MAAPRFGPNTAEVEAFLDRLRHLTQAEWQDIQDRSPSVGAIPALEVEEAPEYFQALREATRIAKSNVFPGSESAFFEAMRTAQLVADASAYQPSSRREPADVLAAEAMNLSPDEEADAITRVMSTAYEEESWRRVMNACMVAAGALVVRRWLSDADFARLYQPIMLDDPEFDRR